MCYFLTTFLATFFPLAETLFCLVGMMLFFSFNNG
jgi:hypothetical protein